MIDWDTPTPHIIPNPFHDLPAPPPLENHIILSTSGTRKPKWVYLSKEAFLVAARSVVAKMDIKASDRWMITLPTYHVAGLSIMARCHVAGCDSVTYSQKKWEPVRFMNELEDCRFTSLVPTQLHDLLKARYLPPPGLKGVLIGGDKLSRNLFDKAIELGWPIYRSYGLTETAAAVAIGDLKGWNLKALPHAEIKVEETVKVKGPSLLTAYYYDGAFYDPKVDGWFDTGDAGIVVGDTFDVIGRLNQFKVGGELFSLAELQEKLDEANAVGAEAVLVVRPCERLGSKVVLFHNHPDVNKIIEPYNERVHPLVKIKEHHYMEKLPRNNLGKIIVDR